jgi:hypothetical protein
MYAATYTYKEVGDGMESGREVVSQAEQNKCQKGDRNTEDECCTKKQKGPPPTY